MLLKRGPPLKPHPSPKTFVTVDGVKGGVKAEPWQASPRKVKEKKRPGKEFRAVLFLRKEEPKKNLSRTEKPPCRIR